MDIAGIVHGNKCELEPVLGYPALGRDADLPVLREKFSRALITIGQIKTSKIRQHIFVSLKSLDFELPNVVSPTAYVSKHSTLGKGNAIMHMSMINSGVVVGDDCIINTKSLVEHDCVIADHCHIAVGAVLCGGVEIGEGSFVGAGAIIKQGLHIGKNAIIGCGAIIHTNIPDNAIIKGQKDA